MALAWLYVVLRIAHSLVFALPFLWRFVERLYGELPALFKDEDELRALWSLPETRKKLLEALADKGFGDAQLAEIKRMIDAEKSDLYDVLAYIAFALAPITREERVNTQKARDILALR